MVNNELKKYLSYVLETEKNVYILKETIATMNRSIQNIGKPRELIPPEYEYSDFSVDDKASLILMAIIGCPIIGAIIGWIVGATKATEGWFIFKLFYADVKYAGVGGGIGLGIALCCVIAPLIISTIGRRNRNKRIKNDYINEIAKENDRASQELTIKDNAIKFYNKTRNQLANTQKVLEKLYSLNIVHYSYRNIVAVASFYQYIDTGMCYELEGENGAYRLYLHESYYRKFDSKLDTIIDMLGEIQSNQLVLQRTLQSASDKIDKLTRLSELSLSYAQATVKNSEIIAYNTEVIKRNTTFLTWMELYKSIK